VVVVVGAATVGGVVVTAASLGSLLQATPPTARARVTRIVTRRAEVTQAKVPGLSILP
jgi:hypothetical protein